jgi:hypothetical protein
MMGLRGNNINLSKSDIIIDILLYINIFSCYFIL